MRRCTRAALAAGATGPPRRRRLRVALVAVVLAGGLALTACAGSDDAGGGAGGGGADGGGGGGFPDDGRCVDSATFCDDLDPEPYADLTGDGLSLEQERSRLVGDEDTGEAQDFSRMHCVHERDVEPAGNHQLDVQAFVSATVEEAAEHHESAHARHGEDEHVAVEPTDSPGDRAACWVDTAFDPPEHAGLLAQSETCP